MGLSLFQLLGHVALIGQGTKEHAELVSVLTRSGFSREDIQAAGSLAEQVEHDLEGLKRGGDVRSHEHAAHVATAEVDMWIQTVTMSIGGLEDDALQRDVVGKDIHRHNHGLSVVMQAQRALSMLQAHPAVQEEVEKHGRLSDIINRGWTLLAKQGVCTDGLIKVAAPDATLWSQHREAMEKVLGRLDSSLATCDALVSLAYLGWVPDGVGTAAGGSSYAVRLHERSHRAAPKRGVEEPCPGWSVGRQGQNRENLGKGFIAPTFE